QHERHQTGHEEIGALTGWIEPCAHLRHDADRPSRGPKLTLVSLNDLQRVGLHRGAGVRFRRVGNDLDARWKSLSEPSGKSGLEKDSGLCVPTLEQSVDLC